jgi:hypothetical protein
MPPLVVCLLAGPLNRAKERRQMMPSGSAELEDNRVLLERSADLTV